MRDDAATRLQKLRDDYEVGQRQLRELEGQAGSLRDTLLRISGAIQVLEELLATRGSDQPEQEATLHVS
jgi:prefoldin subunit 5